MTDDLDRLTRALADRYAIERELGSGGMATVYLAQDLKHDRQVAVKVLRPELAAALGPARFLQEIKIAANLRHPHILPLYDSGEADGFLYYVMPFVEGESLRDRLDREKQLAIDDALRVAREVADALSYAHGHGVIHRDIKPENILLESGHAVVADFGIARAVDAAGGERLTETGIALGTPAYMSPEQAAGEKDLDGRSDLYSLGCVLHEMLAGQPPFTGPTVESLVHQHLTREPPSVTAIRPSVPGSVAAALERSLAKTPADRFNPVALFSEALGSPLSVVTSAPPAVAEPSARQWPLRRIALLAVVAAVVVAAALLLGRSSVRSPEEPSTAADRVIVLPYENRTGDPALDPVGQMAAEWITEGLMQTGTVQVVPNFMALEAVSEARDEGGTVTLSQVAERTQSGIVVTGSYYRHGEDLELHSEVVDVASGAPFTTIDAVVGSVEDPRGAIDSVRIQVMGALATRLSALMGWELPPTAQPPTYEASKAYARAMREWVRTDYEAAAWSFEDAYALDTTYLRSLMLATSAHGNVGRQARSDSLFEILQSRRGELAPYDRYRLDYRSAIVRGDRPAALAAARAGVELVPFGTLRWAFIGSLVLDNRPEEALQSIGEIHSQFITASGGWYYHWRVYTEILHILGDHDRELEVAREAREYISGVLYAMTLEARALAALGRLDELTALVEQILLAGAQPQLTPGEALAELADEAVAHGYQSTCFEIADRALDWLDGQPQAYRLTAAARSLYGRLLLVRERWDEAASVFAALAADSADITSSLAVVSALGYQGSIAAHQGDVESARRFANELESRALPSLRGWNTCWRARIAALLGEREQAVSLLRRAFSEGIGYGIWAHRDLGFESLREYGPFQELMRPKG
jgi:TolB-like protein